MPHFIASACSRAALSVCAPRSRARSRPKCQSERQRHRATCTADSRPPVPESTGNTGRLTTATSTRLTRVHSPPPATSIDAARARLRRRNQARQARRGDEGLAPFPRLCWRACSLSLSGPFNTPSTRPRSLRSPLAHIFIPFFFIFFQIRRRPRLHLLQERSLCSSLSLGRGGGPLGELRGVQRRLGEEHKDGGGA